MSGFLGRLRGGPKLTVQQKHDLLAAAVEMHAGGMTPKAVEQELLARGAPPEDAKALTSDSLRRFESEIVRQVRLPASARLPINYYFLLGVTPRASVEQIHRAYRRKAKAVHPDQHQREFTLDQWSHLMTTVGDAHQVLTDAQMRRAYDVLWRERSRETAAENRRKGEMRGDWETRYRWDIATLAEDEEQIETLIGQIREGLNAGALPAGVGPALEAALEEYEGRLISIRTQTYSLSAKFDWLAEKVRHQTLRKERLVRELHELTTWLPEAQVPTGAQALVGRVGAALEVLAQVREGQNRFDIEAARSAL